MFSSFLSYLFFLLFLLWLLLVRFLVRFFCVSPTCESKAACRFSQKSPKYEVPRPRDYAHRVERKKLIQITGVKIAVGVLKVCFVKKQGSGWDFGPNVVFETLYGTRTGIGGGLFVLALAAGIRTGIGGGYSYW